MFAHPTMIARFESPMGRQFLVATEIRSITRHPEIPFKPMGLVVKRWN